MKKLYDHLYIVSFKVSVVGFIVVGRMFQNIGACTSVSRISELTRRIFRLVRVSFSIADRLKDYLMLCELLLFLST